MLDVVADGSLPVVLAEPLPVDDIVEAYRCVDSGHKVGDVVTVRRVSPDPGATPTTAGEHHIT